MGSNRIKYLRKSHSDETLRSLYLAMLKPRLTEERMLVLLRQNKISKWFSGIGQEAISGGVISALKEDVWVLPQHRNLGVFMGRGLPTGKLFAQWQGKVTGYTNGRDRSFHFGVADKHIFGMISHLGAHLPVANGLALAHQLKKDKKIVVAFCGDGTTSEGDFHEAINLASVWKLPVMFILENNGYGLSTPNNEQFACESLVDKAPGYGINAIQVDGNNVLEVYEAVKKIGLSMEEEPGPVLVEALTFRMRGHEEASGTKYVPAHLLEEWSAKDPIENFEAFLLAETVYTPEDIGIIKENLQNEILSDIEDAETESFPVFDLQRELADVYAPFHLPDQPDIQSGGKEKRLIDAIADTLSMALRLYPNLVLMGQDIAEYGGVFKATEGLLETFGSERIRNTPISESGTIGAALGLAAEGFKTVVEMQFADFISCGFNQVVNNLAKVHYRWGVSADVVIRMPTGAGVGAGPFHSQSNEAWFYHTPGLKIFYPSNPYDAKGLLATAIADPNPVLFFEHKALYRSVTGHVPDDWYLIEEGKAVETRRGSAAVVISYGMGVHWAREIIEKAGFDVGIIDLRTLLPWDKETVYNAVKATGKVLVLTEDTLTGSIASDIAAWISENCFALLDAPVMREGSLDMPIPFSMSLEEGFLPKNRLHDKLKSLLDY